MRGRKPESKKTLELRGSSRAKDRTAEPRGPALAGELQPPAFFDETACNKWWELLPILRTMGTLTGADMDNFRAYCVAYARWVRAETELAREGPVIEHRNHVTGLSHWLRVAESALARMDKSGGEIGLSASTRPRLKTTEPKPAIKVTGKERFFMKCGT